MLLGSDVHEEEKDDPIKNKSCQKCTGKRRNRRIIRIGMRKSENIKKK